MNRRGFFSALAALAATAALDPEQLLWVPGKKTIFIPPPSGGNVFLHPCYVTNEMLEAASEMLEAVRKLWKEEADIRNGMLRARFRQLEPARATTPPGLFPTAGTHISVRRPLLVDL